MFFRPEEIHRTSGVGGIGHPFSHGNGYMADQSFRVLRLDLAVLDLDSNGLFTIKAGGIDLYRFSRKQPADRQRFKGSLAEPLLFIVNSQAVVVRGIVEGCK
jgi:hypothetical protein